ncbi:hypothetical protein [Jidongwangia harbinensis]|uniref:hypothetical protein n=1 Tax=Jidongwangia harbinensis TaxID=2878561 RepID=UPI001CDA467E|nr:hypothetical protein [Jidongwangia harbinensis]MCA2214806.1 hypothetical protein [Jidongwangia harbinensis]
MRRTTWAVLALLPALLSGCSAVPGLSTGAGGTGTAAAEDPAGGEEWLVSDRGRPTPSAKPVTGTAPKPTPTGGFLPLPSTSPTAKPVAKCSPNTFKFDQTGSLNVRPGPTSAVLSWYNVGGSNLVEFRLYAISQDLASGRQRDIGFTTIKPGAKCGWMSATIGNLDRRTEYVFSVDAVTDRRSGDGTYAATVARSGSTPTT